MNNRKKGLALSRKKMAAIIGGVVGVVLIAWIVLMVVLFGKKKPKDNPKPEEPKDETVFRLKAYYDVSDKGEKSIREIYEYDELGRLTMQTRFDEKGNTDSTRTVTYDDAGNVVEYLNKFKIGEGDALWRWQFAYHPSGKLKEAVLTDENDFVHQRDVYNDKGGMISHYYYEYEFSRQYTYNDKGDLLMTQRIMDSGETVIEEENVYSDAGLLLQTISEINNTKVFYSYDEAGKRTKSQKFLGEELISEDIYYTMNVDELHCDTHVFTDGGEYYHITNHYEYDEKGRVKRYTLYSHGGGIEQDYTCEYDADGNETRREYYDEEGNLDFGFDYTYNDLSMRVGEYCKAVSWDGPNRDFVQSEEVEYFIDEGIPCLFTYPAKYTTPGYQQSVIYSVTNMSDGEKSGWYFEKDADGNPTKKIWISLSGDETVVGEREYTKMTIKKQGK